MADYVFEEDFVVEKVGVGVAGGGVSADEVGG